jgi:hypothetical protein
MDFFHLLPGLEPWVQNLATVWPASVIKPSIWMFAVIEAVHLLALAALGGCVLLLNFRLMGVGLTNEPASVVEKNVRPWQLAGIIVVLLTGISIGMSNAEKLYTSPAFFVKMLSMVAALILSLGVANSVARHEGQVTMPAKVMAGIALVFWLVAIYVFGTVTGANPGSFHLVCAGWLIAMGFGSKMTRIILGSITAVTVVTVGIITYLVFTPTADYAVVMEINKWTVRIGALLIAGFIAWEFVGTKGGHTMTPTLARLVGLFTILAWVTVAAGGRWIGLS